MVSLVYDNKKKKKGNCNANTPGSSEIIKRKKPLARLDDLILHIYRVEYSHGSRKRDSPPTRRHKCVRCKKKKITSVPFTNKLKK